MLLGNIDGWPSETHPDLKGRVTVDNLNRVAFAPFSWNADHASGCAGLALDGTAAHMHVVPIWTGSDKAVYWFAYTRTRTLEAAYKHFVSKGVKCVNRELNSGRSSTDGMEAIWGTRADLDLVSKYPQMVHVQPAGNQGKPISNQPYYKPVSTLDHLLIVVAVDESNKAWPLSNTPQGRCFYEPGVRPIPEANYLKNFVVCAPGVNILCPASPSGSWRPSGTSFAAPFVQRLVALMYEKAPTLTPQACARIIKETCKKIGPPEIYGHGLIDVKAALEAVGQ